MRFHLNRSGSRPTRAGTACWFDLVPSQNCAMGESHGVRTGTPMKTVILLRHAKSDWSDTVQRDFDRPLNARGQRAARVMGEWARNNGITFDSIVASPAVRVIETLDHFLEGYASAVDIRWDRRIYLASSATLLDVLRDLPDTIGVVLMAGHNPGLEDLVLDLGAGDAALRAEVEIKFPTASMARIRFDVDHWAKLGESGQLDMFRRPRDVDPALGPEPGSH